jgi:predicted nucleic acid-binding Zn ribbon protein
VKRRFTDNVPAFCPNCGGEAYRCFSTVPIIFKGSGFYTTDNRQESKFEGEADKDKVLDKNED